jgi:hypothetical protein
MVHIWEALTDTTLETRWAYEIWRYIVWLVLSRLVWIAKARVQEKYSSTVVFEKG